MTKHLLAAVSMLALVAACSPLAPGDAGSSAAETVPVTDRSEATLSSSCSAPVMRYACESGARVDASYRSDDTASIDYRGVVHPMQLAISASGARYVGDALEWWTKGREAILSRLLEDGTSGEIIERCTVQAERGC